VHGNWRANLVVRRAPELSLFHLLFHERAKCQSLTGGNCNGYLRSVGDKASEELRLLRTVHICRHSTCCHCCSDDVIVGQRARVRSERQICGHALSSGCPGCANVKAAVLHNLYGPQIAIGKASLVSTVKRSYRLSGECTTSHERSTAGNRGLIEKNHSCFFRQRRESMLLLRVDWYPQRATPLRYSRLRKMLSAIRGNNCTDLGGCRRSASNTMP
jgi:hypothetical protein